LGGLNYMPAKSKQQLKLIYVKRGQYQGIEITPDDWKWIWDKEWDDIDYTKLPDKISNEHYLYENNILKNKQEIEDWLNTLEIENFTVNNDLTVDVDDNVDISDKNLTEIPVQFNKINGWFNCSGNKELKSLKGCPQIGITDFLCRDCDLRDLKGVPKEIKGRFECGDNEKLNSLKGCPQIGVTYFWCYNCDLRDLEGAPKEIEDNFDCHGNKNFIIVI